MSLLEKLKFRNGLQRAWCYESEGVIWRVMHSPPSHLVGEERNLEQKKVSFFCIDQTSGKTLWRGRSFGEQWWMGLENTGSGVIFLHGYDTPEMPGRRHIVAVEVATGKELWRNDLVYRVAAGRVVFGSRDSVLGEELIELDQISGQEIKSWGRDVSPLEHAFREVEQNQAVRFPSPFHPHAGVADVALSVSFPDRNFPGSVEFLEHGHYVVFGFLGRTEGAAKHADQCLKVVDMNSKSVVLHEVLVENIPALVPESFFVEGETLYFVRRQRFLTAVRLLV